MSDWGSSTYGDPCRECGFSWATTPEAAIALVAAFPTELRGELLEADGWKCHPELDWPVVAYVCHVADNLRIWAERLAGIALSGNPSVAPYDENLLAAARRYNEVTLAGALWSLGRAVDDWSRAVELAGETGIVMVHPERGELALVDVVRATAHDAAHHRWDIERTLRTMH